MKEIKTSLNLFQILLQNIPEYGIMNAEFCNSAKQKLSLSPAPSARLRD